MLLLFIYNGRRIKKNMAKKQSEEQQFNYQLDDTFEEETLIPISEGKVEPKQTVTKRRKQSEDEPLISCLKNEKIIVRYIKKPNSNIKDPRHIAYGGLIDTAFIMYTVPMLRSGSLVNVLTDSEKAFLEDIMGLDHNALSIYAKKDNYWSNYRVRLTKDDTYLDLSTPEDFIKYKVLLANKEDICPSMEELENRKKATYRFVIINEGDETKQTNEKMTTSMEASIELGKILENKTVLKFVVETLSSKPIAKSSKLDFIQAQAFNEMQSNPKLFLRVAKDPYLKTKVLISECLEYGIIKKRNDLYYISASNEPMCESGEESTLSTSAKYLNSPKRQEVKLMLEAKLKAVKE